MSQPASKARPDTAAQILDLAETLIQTRGFCAFSYQDISEALGITKASIHYHFPSKAELGRAVGARYVARFGAMLAAIGEDPGVTSRAMLERYYEPYRTMGATPDRICLCGALAAEFMAVPEAMRPAIAGFFQAHQAWLAAILERGAARGEFTLNAPPARAARLMFDALQGGLLVRRATGDASQLADIISALEAQLSA